MCILYCSADITYLLGQTEKLSRMGPNKNEMSPLNGMEGVEWCQQQLFISAYTKLWQQAYFKANWDKTKIYMTSMISFPINFFWQYNFEK